jgi:short-subunit dehydrogenase
LRTRPSSWCQRARHRPGTNRGYARLARHFAADGYDLIITATNSEILERTADAVRAARVSAEIVVADVTKFDGVESLYAIAATGRPLAAAALNAGVGLGGYFIGGTDLEAEVRLIQLNVVS